MYYRLDESKNLVRCKDVLEWGRWFETADRQVARTEVMGADVSTVFLGVAHCNNVMTGGPDMSYLFETMVFADDSVLEQLGREAREDITSVFAKVGCAADVQRRYRTWQEAEAGHAEMVSHVARVLAARN